MSTSAPLRVPQALAEAALDALRAPSVFNTQPWHWQLHGDRLELRAERTRQLAATDPDGRLLTLSCGAALHHARISVAANGYQPVVERLPDPNDPDLLATVRCGQPREADEVEARLHAAIPRRRSDRRPYSDEPVPVPALRALRAAATAAGAYLHVVRPDQLPMLAIAAAEANATQVSDPAYRLQLTRWTHRPPAAGDGVPSGTAIRPAPRRVPVRDFALDGQGGLDVGEGTDRGTRYAVLFGATDDPPAWLRAGEALSALLLTAVDLGLSASPMSDVVEVMWPRQMLRDLLAGLGEPYLVVRVGFAGKVDELPPAPRRSADDAVGTGDPCGDPRGDDRAGPEASHERATGRG